MKERTLRGVFQGKRLVLGYADGQPVVATVWDGLLMVKQGLSTDYVLPVGSRYLAGGLWWRMIPHAISKNPRAVMYYPDTLMNCLTLVVRPWLRSKRFVWRRLHG